MQGYLQPGGRIQTLRWFRSNCGCCFKDSTTFREEEGGGGGGGGCLVSKSYPGPNNPDSTELKGAQSGVLGFVWSGRTTRSRQVLFVREAVEISHRPLPLLAAARCPLALPEVRRFLPVAKEPSREPVDGVTTGETTGDRTGAGH